MPLTLQQVGSVDSRCGHTDQLSAIAGLGPLLFPNLQNIGLTKARQRYDPHLFSVDPASLIFAVGRTSNQRFGIQHESGAKY